MSSNHPPHGHSGHGSGHGPAPREITHPMLWAAGMFGFMALVAWWFAHQFLIGEHEGRAHPLPPLAQAAPAYAGPDHAVIVGEMVDPASAEAQALLKLGKLNYATCATCHGADGQLGANGARKYVTDPLKHGKGDIYHFYTMITKGAGQMAAQIKPDSDENARKAYAVAYYVHETFFKGKEGQYIAVDDAYLAAKPWGAGGGTAVVASTKKGYELKAEPLAVPVEGVLSQRAEVAAEPAGQSLRRAAQGLSGAAHRQWQTLVDDPAQGVLQRALLAAAQADDVTRFLALLAGPGPDRSALVLLAPHELHALLARVKVSATAGKEH